jgi:hypothetical protein
VKGFEPDHAEASHLHAAVWQVRLSTAIRLRFDDSKDGNNGSPVGIADQQGILCGVLVGTFVTPVGEQVEGGANGANGASGAGGRRPTREATDLRTSI